MKMTLFLFLSLIAADVVGQNVAGQSGARQSTAAQSGESRRQMSPRIPATDRVRLAEAFRIGETLGDRVWRGWSRAPFAVLLVTPGYEFLIRHPRPSADFTALGYDALLKSDIYYRPRTQRIDLLATFPIVGGISTIVIGQAANTKKTSTEWVVTVLHEHFHQLQNSQTDYRTAVDELNLSGGDETGMWMLNYAFPYTDPAVKGQFVVLSRLLADALRAKRKADFSAKLTAYLDARRQLEKMLEPDDYRYLSFQMWQEGVARYTEYRTAKLAARGYKPSRAFMALPDYQPFEKVADAILANVLENLSSLQLEGYKRVAFYPLGAGEALLLDRANPRWQSLYFTEKFYVERYFKRAR